jgi:hypothetical protein
MIEARIPADCLTRSKSDLTLTKTALYIDPASHHFFNDRLFDIEGANLAGDKLLAPYVQLRAQFQRWGIPVRTADFLPESAGTDVRNIYVSLGAVRPYDQLSMRKDIVLSALFAVECPIVEPAQFKQLSRARRYFKRIFSWSDSDSLERFTGCPIELHSFNWPQSFDDVHEHLWERKNRRFLVMINANKLPRLYVNELYTERLRAIDYFSRRGEIDLYGKGWDRPALRVGTTWVPWTVRRGYESLQCKWNRIFPDLVLASCQRAYRGPTASKSETLGEYTFALCFENMVLKGWITEKIFDCFFAGTIPVYWGAPDIQEHIPKNCFIDMREFSNYSDLRDHLRSLDSEDIDQLKINARQFLRSPEFQPFSKAAFVDIFRRIVEEDAGIQLSRDMANAPCRESSAGACHAYALADLPAC